MREDQVANGVNFLVHPKAKAAPLSQRISFLENKGLTAEEISTALSRVEGGSDGTNQSTTATGNTPTTPGTLSSTAQPFPAEASVPLWRQAAVPGALVLGAVGALGAYYASSHQPAGSGRQSYSGGSAVSGGTAGAGLSEARVVDSIRGHPEDGYAQDGAGQLQSGDGGQLLQRVDGGAGTAFLSDGVMDSSFPRNGEEASGVGPAGETSSSVLAGEFRRMTDTMEQQTGHLVEAVGAMKALASRAEQDSSSLLAARVNSHTSELRAELDTIKQLLLRQQAGVEGATSTLNSGASAEKFGARGLVVGNAATDGKTGVDGAKDSGAGNGAVGIRDGEGMRGQEDEQMRVVKSRLAVMEAEKEKAKEAADKAAAEAAALAATERRKNTARAALSALLADNAPHAAKDGIAMLRMLVANLVNQPNVPRYRRIASSNDNFKKRLLPLEGYKAMMEAVGFRAKGSLWEWTWHEDSGPSASSDNKAVLEDIVKAIDAVARPNGPPLSSASPITSSSTSAAAPLSPAAAAFTPQPAAAIANGKPPGDNKAVAASVNGVVGNSRFPDTAAAAVAAVGRASDGGAIKGVDGNTTSAISAEVVQPRTAGAEAVKTFRAKEGILAAAAEANGIGKGAGEMSRSAELVEGAPAEASSEEPVAAAVSEPARAGGGAEAAAAEQGAPPASIAEVAAAIQRGDEPPGIRVVEDRLSADATTLPVSSQPSPPKPWEFAAGKGATHDAAVGEITGGGPRTANGGGSRDLLNAGEGRSRPQHAVAVGP